MAYTKSLLEQSWAMIYSFVYPLELLFYLTNAFHRYQPLWFKQSWHKTLCSCFWIYRKITIPLKPMTSLRALRMSCLTLFSFLYQFQYQSREWGVRLKQLHFFELCWNYSAAEWTVDNMDLPKSIRPVRTLTYTLRFSASQRRESSKISIQRKCTMNSWSLRYSLRWKLVCKIWKNERRRWWASFVLAFEQNTWYDILKSEIVRC